MEYRSWAPYYSRILRDFGFDRGEDERAALLLSGMLAKRKGVSRPVPPSALRKLLRGREVLVVGGAIPSTDACLDGKTTNKPAIISADGATTFLLRRGIVPDIITTDLDGPFRDISLAGREGAVVVVHAHGNNIPALRRYVPRLMCPVMGTTQAEPLGNVHNFSGFTDGDRAVFLAHHFGARKITLIGFDFKRPYGKKVASARRMKAKKLKWAERLIGVLERRGARITRCP